LLQYGFQAVIGPSFADIFFNNSFQNGLLLIKLPSDVVDRLFKEVAASPGYRLAVDLDQQTVTTPGGEVLKFDIDPFRKHCCSTASTRSALRCSTRTKSKRTKRSGVPKSHGCFRSGTGNPGIRTQNTPNARCPCILTPERP
jgi:3-isopropylmalate dehydratase small subunit